MLNKCEMAPADPILGLTEAYHADTRADKINLGVGIYQTETNQTPVMAAVKQTEAYLVENQLTKRYLSIEGWAAYNQQVTQLLWGEQQAAIADKRLLTAQAPGGTGALRVAGEFLYHKVGARRLWLSQPTWANHRAIFEAVGFEMQEYTYYNNTQHQLDFDGMLHDLQQAKAGDVVLLHACCHNPTGADPSHAQWQQLAQLCQAKQLLPLFDAAYLGFAEGIDQDAYAIRHFADQVPEMMVANSFSKNFSLYNERVGSVSLLAQDPTVAGQAFSQLKKVIRALYSNPPAHGAMVVAHILQDENLSLLWQTELMTMRERIADMRALLVKGLNSVQTQHDYSFIGQQRGMFSFSGLSPQQVEQLQTQAGIYMVGSGRISIAGINTSNIHKLTQSIQSVL
jgi:aromatic-amino-acid transaminase